jgi:S1-C subfamily serine protease
MIRRRIALFFASIFVIISACAFVASAAGQSGGCPEGHPETGDLGISHLLCVGGSCSVNLRTGRGYAHDFSTEPRIQGLDRNGPAWGRLQDGDILVAIDNILITTLEGGRRLANLTPGRPVELRIRREGREMEVTVVPRLGCNMPMLAVRKR